MSNCTACNNGKRLSSGWKCDICGRVNRSELAATAGSTECSEYTRAIRRPHFNGNIWTGGGVDTCSRKATMIVAGKPYCTFHGKRKTPPND